MVCKEHETSREIDKRLKTHDKIEHSDLFRIQIQCTGSGKSDSFRIHLDIKNPLIGYSDIPKYFLWWRGFKGVVKNSLGPKLLFFSHD